MSAVDSGLHIHDEKAEQAVLGIMLLNDVSSTAEARSRLLPEDFYLPYHRDIFRACATLDDNNDPVEPAAALHVLASQGRLGHIPGGALYLSELIGQAPAATSLAYYIRIVKDSSAKRGIAEVGLQAQSRAVAGGDVSASSLIETLRNKLDDLSATHNDSELLTVDAGISPALSDIEQLQTHGVITGVGTGFTDLDSRLCGLQPGQVIIVAARPGLGKSSFALDVARHAAVNQGKSVLFFSLEMSRAELVMRVLSAEGRVDVKAMRTQGGLTDMDWQKLARASERLRGKLLGIDDTATSTIADIRAKALAWQRRHGLDLIVIDYLQLMNAVVRSPSRQQEVAEISRGVKLLAKELSVPVVALSQLNRGLEQRQDKKPLMSDLRESGALEQDADIVLLLHREEVYDPETERAGEADVIIAKQRSGPTGQVSLAWLGKYSRFDNRATF